MAAMLLFDAPAAAARLRDCATLNALPGGRGPGAGFQVAPEQVTLIALVVLALAAALFVGALLAALAQRRRADRAAAHAGSAGEPCAKRRGRGR